MASDYERLKKEGYTEEEIRMQLDESLSQVSLSDAPMAKGREDKSATISDKEGRSMRTSNVMMGYNRRGLNLPSGVYVNADELVSAMTTFLTEDSENKTIVCRRTGEIVDVSTLTSTVMEGLVAGAGLTLVGTSSKITNQTAYNYGIRGDDKNTRIFMTGNQGLQLPNGEYVTIAELQGAISNYVYMFKDDIIVPPIIPPEPPVENLTPPRVETPIIVPSNLGESLLPTNDSPQKFAPQEEEEKEEKHVVTGRKKWEKWQTIALAVGTATVMLIASLGLDDVITQKQVTTITNQASYSVSQMTEENIYESAEDAIQRAVSEFSTGDSVFIEDGTRYDHESDKATDKHGIIGEGLREEGYYTLDYVSIIDSNNNIIRVEFQEGVNVGDVVNQTLDAKNLAFDDVQVRVHIGGPVTGWIDMSDILSEETITPQLIESKFVVENTYSDVQENFDGTIDVTTDNGTVELDVMNPNGTLVSEGTTLTGSDGLAYQVDILDVTSKTATTTTEEKVGEKLTLSVDHLIDHAGYAAIAEALLVGGVISLGAALNKKKKEEEKKQAEKKAEAEFEAASYTSGFDQTLQQLAAMPPKNNEEVIANTNQETLGGHKR